jgi:hypothetical protein
MSMAKPKEIMEAGESDETKELLIRQVRADMDEWFEDPWWTLSEVKNAATYYLGNSSLVDQFWQKLEDPLLRPLMDEYGNQVKDDNGRPIYLDIKQYINTKHFRGMFEKWIRDDMRIRLANMDVITQLGAMRAYPFSSMKGEYWSDRTPWFYLKNFNPWGFASIYGNPGSGKSDFACTLMEDALSMKYFTTRLPSNFIPFRIVTNIKINELPDGLVFTRKFSTMIATCIDNLLNYSSLTLVILDELGQYFSRKTAMSKKYRDMEKMIFLLRKPSGSMIGIVQRPEDIPSVVESFSETHFYKKAPTKLMIKHGAKRTIINHVPPTNLRYDHRDPASLVIDIDMDDFHGFITEVMESGESVLPKMMGYLKSNRSFQLNDFQINNYIKVARLKREPRPTYEEIGWELGMSGSAISQRCKKLGILDKQMEA